MADKLRTNYGSRKRVNLRGSALNRIGRAINSRTSGLATTQSSFSGLINQPIPTPPLKIGVAEITSSDNLCDVDPIEGETQAPCASDGKYLAAMRFWESDERKWSTEDEELRVDSSIYAEQGTGIPKFSAGDKIPVLFDPRRNWLIPLISPGSQAERQPYRNFVCQQRQMVPRTLSALYTDATEICLEQQSSNDWEPLLPSLLLQPRQPLSAASTATEVLAVVKGGDLLRLSCGTSFYSRSVMGVVEAGICIRFLSKIDGQNFVALGIPRNRSSTAGFTGLPEYSPFGYVNGATSDAPTADAFGNTVRVNAGAGAQWLAAITIYAEVDKLNLDTFVKVFYPGDSESAEFNPQLDHLHQVGAERVHPGIVVDWDGTGFVDKPSTQPDVDQSCWLAFAGGSTQVAAMHGYCYGPCQRMGTFRGNVNGEESTRPLYLMNPPTEEVEGTHVGDLAKGASADFHVLNGDGSDTGFTINAEVRYNAYTSGKKAIIKRLNGVWIANPVEC